MFFLIMQIPVDLYVWNRGKLRSAFHAGQFLHILSLILII